jgi:hypothetical protein
MAERAQRLGHAAQAEAAAELLAEHEKPVSIDTSQEDGCLQIALPVGSHDYRILRVTAQ